jgi:polysaccharide biosynthesis/export protein
LGKPDNDEVLGQGEVNDMKTGTLIACSVFMVLLAVVACAPNAVVTPGPARQIDQQARTYSEGEYVLGAGDVLDIKFIHNPEFNELALPIRPDGRLSLQLAPDIKVAGLTPSKLRDVLTRYYATELKEPEATVVVRSFASKKVFVDGEVGGPRLVDLIMPTTVMRAITQAGGLRETARLSSVIVIRPDFEGKPVGTMVDLRKVIDGTDFTQDIYLMPYDIVYVPKSNIARVNLFVQQYITSMVPGLSSWAPYALYYNNGNN